MKKLLGSLVAGAVLLLPTAASAATVSGSGTGSTITTPIFVVGGSSGSTGSTGSSTSSGSSAGVTGDAHNDGHAKPDPGPGPGPADQPKHDGRNDDGHHTGDTDHQSTSGGEWQDASAVHGGGMKFG